jgi:hypothetical protein
MCHSGGKKARRREEKVKLSHDRNIFSYKTTLASTMESDPKRMWNRSSRSRPFAIFHKLNELDSGPKSHFASPPPHSEIVK